ncbi:MAG: hypothetical protein RIE24_18665 [Silicimonas sp.]
MFRFFFKPPERMSKALAEELQSLCHRSQVQALTQSRHLQRDIGIDCGCDQPGHSELRLPL